MRASILIFGLILVSFFNILGKPIVIQGHVFTKYIDSVFLKSLQTPADYFVDRSLQIKKLDRKSNCFFQFITDAPDGCEFNLELQYSSIFRDVFLIPGDTLNVEYCDTFPPYVMKIEYSGSGKGAVIIQQMLEKDFYGEDGDHHSDEENCIVHLSKEDFRNYVDARMQYLLNLVDIEANIYSMSNAYINHEKQYIEYGSGDIIRFYAHMNKFFIKRSDSIQGRKTAFWDFVKLLQLENKSALNVSTYYRFLDCYIDFIAEQNCIRQPLYKQHFFQSDDEFLLVCDSLCSGIDKYIVYAETMKRILYRPLWVPYRRNQTSLETFDRLLSSLRISTNKHIKRIHSFYVKQRKAAIKKSKLKDKSIINIDYSPEIKLIDKNGIKSSTYDYKGKFILLHFWDPYDTDQIKQDVELQKFREELKKEDVIVISICRCSGFTDSQKIELLNHYNYGIIRSSVQNGNGNNNSKVFNYTDYVLIGKNLKVIEDYYDLTFDHVKPLVLDNINNQ